MSLKANLARRSWLVVVLLLIVSFATGCSGEKATAGVPSTNKVNTGESPEEFNNPYKVKVEDPTPEFYVNDFAGIFTNQQKNDMINNAACLEQDYDGVQVVVTTVKSFGESTADEYAYAMYAQYEIGRKDMGILIVIATEDKDLYIESGLNMQIYLTDKLLDDISERRAMDLLRAGQFAEGIYELQYAIIQEIPLVVPKDWEADLGIEDNPDKVSADQEQISNTKNNAVNISRPQYDWITITAICIGFLLALIMFARERSNNKKINRLEQKLEKEKGASKLKAQELEEDFEKKKEEFLKAMRQRMEVLGKEHRAALKERTQLQTELDSLKARYERAKKLYPRMDSEIDNMIKSELKEQAGKFDEQLIRVARLPASKENVEKFSQALETFASVPEAVRPYLRIGEKTLKVLYQQSVDLRQRFEQEQKKRQDEQAVKTAYEYIKKIMLLIQNGRKEDYDDLKEAYSKYESLTQDQKAIFPDQQLITRLDKEKRAAQQDLTNFETATEAHRKVKSIVDAIYQADEDDLDELEAAQQCYSELTDEQQEYFDASTYKRLTQLLKQAREDYEEQEAERERIRRQSTYNSIAMASSMRSPMSGFSSSAGSSRSTSVSKGPSARPSSSGVHRSSGMGTRPSGGAHRGLGGRPSGGGVHKKL